MKLLFLVTTILLLLLTTTIRAEINMKDAGYTAHFKDFPELKRSYNSRSIYRGIFGFGWCANVEKSLQVLSTRRIILKNCGNDSDFSLLSEDNFTKSRIYMAEAISSQIEFKNGLYVFKNGHEQVVFNRKGQMIQMTNKNRKIDYRYKNNQLIEIRTNTQRLILRYNKDKNVIEIRESEQTLMDYSYEGVNLSNTINSKKERHRFEYNALNNLESLTRPDGSIERIAYNNDFDQVVKVTKPNGCTEYFEFTTNQDNQLYQIARMVQRCGTAPALEKTFEFWNQYREDGRTYLDRYKVQYASELEKSSIEITYHPFNGSPIKIIKDGKHLL